MYILQYSIVYRFKRDAQDLMIVDGEAAVKDDPSHQKESREVERYVKSNLAQAVVTAGVFYEF